MRLRAPSACDAVKVPRSRLDKLGVKPGMRVGVIGVVDDVFLGELEQAGAVITRGRAPKAADLVILRLDAKAELPKLAKARESLRANGAVWVIWPKGVKAFREDDIRAYGPQAGLVDVKVMSFSTLLSGLKMVIPLALR